MSEQCHVCGPIRHEAPTVICAPCAIQQVRSDEARRRLESLIPLADALRAIDAVNEKVFRPFIYNPLAPR